MIKKEISVPQKKEQNPTLNEAVNGLKFFDNRLRKELKNRPKEQKKP